MFFLLDFSLDIKRYSNCKRFLFGYYYFDFDTYIKRIEKLLHFQTIFVVRISLIWKRCRGYVKPGRTPENRSYE